jgi:hypothetical protein
VSVQIGQNTAGTEAARELGRRSAAVRRKKTEAVRRLVEASRAAQGLPPTVTDIEVLERVAALLENGGGPDAA